jgi:FkbM family methyltransferase
MNAKARIHEFLHRLGLDLVPYSGAYFQSKRRVDLMHRHGINVVVDVGANRGQYAREIRRDGWRGRIVSLEPLPDAYRLLSAAADRDPSWRALNVAAGSNQQTLPMNVAANSWSSSLLPIGDRHLAVAPESRYTHSIEVPVERVDDVLERVGEEGRPYLKADTQGYELEVLRGAERTLARAPLVELELSLVELYSGQPLLPAVARHLLDRGFAPVSLEQSFVCNGKVIQLNGIFVRLETDD